MVVTDLQTLRRAFGMLDRDLRRRSIWLILMGIFAAALEATGALGIFWLIGIVSSPGTAVQLPLVGALAETIGFNGEPFWIIWCAIGVMAFYGFKNAVLMWHYYQQVKLPHDAYVRVSTALLRYYLETTYAFHFDRNSAEVVRNMMESVDIVFRTVLINALTLGSEIMVVVAMLAILVAVSPSHAIIVSGSVAVLTWGMLRLTHRRMASWGAVVQSQHMQLIKVLNQGLGAIKEVKVLNREGYFVEQYRKLRDRQSQVMRYFESFQNLPLFVLEVALTFALGGLIILLSLHERDQASTIPLLGLYAYSGFRLMPALARIAAKLQRLSFGAAAVNEVYADYSALQRDIAAVPINLAPLPFGREIRIDNVVYTYPKAPRPALNGVSLTIPRGTSVGIVGASGGGKSTLIDILLGLLIPDSGQVLVDGKPVLSSLRAWQRNLGYVPQSHYLLDDTLRRNIAFGVADGEIDEAAVMEALRMAQLIDLVATLPQGLDTQIGERGIRLSGGQRQRIVIARALYRQPQVLVFDEATSELDNLTEVEIASEIEELSGQKTIVIIAHRMTTVRNCDFIVFLVAGRVVDTGTYEELLARNSDFRRVVSAHEAPLDPQKAPVT
jgi:ATP-binding cassette subfamily C protein